MIAKVKSSSSDDIYLVDFISENGLIKVTCSCQAGLNNLSCKHRTSIFSGDYTSFVDEGNKNEIIDFIENNNTKIIHLYSEQTIIEAEILELNKKLKKIKKDVGIKLNKGF